MTAADERPTVLEIPIDVGGIGVVDGRLGEGGGLLHVATVNPEYVMLARSDREFAAALLGADVHLADGVGIVLALRLRGFAATRATGVALSEQLIASGRPTFLLGAGPGVADEAAAKLKARHPGACVVGTWADGSPDARDDAESLRRIDSSGAAVVLVAFGARGQLLWIERNRRRLSAMGVRVAVGVGGALDYHAGRARIAHPLVRRAGLEWLDRLIREPWRWRRQLVLPHFALLAGRESLRARRGTSRRGLV